MKIYIKNRKIPVPVPVPGTKKWDVKKVLNGVSEYLLVSQSFILFLTVWNVDPDPNFNQGATKLLNRYLDPIKICIHNTSFTVKSH